MTRDFPLLNTLHLPVRWVDMDAYQHVNSSRYFDYMCEIRCMLLTDLMQYADQCQFVVAQTGCTFKRPYSYPDTIILKQYCENISASSYTLFYEFLSENNPDLIFAEGFAKMVCFNPQTKSVLRVPSSILERLGAK